VTTELEYEAWRVDCPRCGVTIELVPWADAQSGFTRPFEDVVAYLAQRADKTTVSTLMRIAWRTVGRIIERVVARLGHAREDRFADRREPLEELASELDIVEHRSPPFLDNSEASPSASISLTRSARPESGRMTAES
jgi:transposase